MEIRIDDIVKSSVVKIKRETISFNFDRCFSDNDENNFDLNVQEHLRQCLFQNSISFFNPKPGRAPFRFVDFNTSATINADLHATIIYDIFFLANNYLTVDMSTSDEIAIVTTVAPVRDIIYNEGIPISYQFLSINDAQNKFELNIGPELSLLVELLIQGGKFNDCHGNQITISKENFLVHPIYFPEISMIHDQLFKSIFELFDLVKSNIHRLMKFSKLLKSSIILSNEVISNQWCHIDSQRYIKAPPPAKYYEISPKHYFTEQAIPLIKIHKIIQDKIPLKIIKDIEKMGIEFNFIKYKNLLCSPFNQQDR